MSSEALERADEMIAALLAEVARLEQERDEAREEMAEYRDELHVETQRRSVAEAALAVARERAEKAERERDEAQEDVARCAADTTAPDLAQDVEFLKAEKEQGDREREQRLAKALARAVYVAQHLVEMIDRDTWRATGGDDGQGHYEGDYRAERVIEEIEEWAALVDEPAAATLAEPGRGEWKPPARVGEECSPVTADVTTPAPGSASAAADEPGKTPCS